MNWNGLFCKNTWPAIADIPVTVCLCLALYVNTVNINNISHKRYDYQKVLCCTVTLTCNSAQKKLMLAKNVCLSNVTLADQQ